jgi:Protein of unknown function (DUF1376)
MVFPVLMSPRGSCVRGRRFLSSGEDLQWEQFVSTDPLVPRNIDLRDFAYMPLDTVRLRDSSMALKASDAEFRAAVILWCVAWHQVPAGSLPNDDDDLASFVGFGRDVRKWRRLREGALRGFQLCSDGRLYHPVLAEKALEAFTGKLRLRHRRCCERIKKNAQRHKTAPHYPTFEEWKEHLDATGSDEWRFLPDLSQGTIEACPEDVPRESLPLKGIGDRGEGIGDRGEVISSTTLTASTHTPQSTDPIERACALMVEAGCKSVSKSRRELHAAIREGVTPEELADTVREAIAGSKTSPFAWAITTARRRLAEAPKPVNGASTMMGKAATPSATAEPRRPADPQRIAGFMTQIKAKFGW